MTLDCSPEYVHARLPWVRTLPTSLLHDSENCSRQPQLTFHDGKTERGYLFFTHNGLLGHWERPLGVYGTAAFKGHCFRPPPTL